MEAYYCQTTPQSRKISGGDYGKGRQDTLPPTGPGGQVRE